MEVNKEKIRYILQLFFDKGENASQAAEIVNGVDGADTVTANYVQFWINRFRPNIKFRSLLFATGPFDANDRAETARIGQQKRCCVPSRERLSTNVCSDSPETLGA
ncbi:hypothetical protein TNCV_2333821 [Trichonephila clavipes]|nr:hypothetical protein TNCV_2333821 [Trichonephila clavipes]